MLQNDFAPLWAVSLGVVVPLVAVVGVCICGCRKTVPKNDLHGLPGMVKITNPDEACNHQLAIEVRDNNAAGCAATSVEACDMSRRL
ncbi:Uncharacterized protein GBIM_20989 [Gryllus bimaculatus]|nr:Uncharacterized protein GBIM_20989 [Gryllus bimaculatus]